jgi:hypothetical protein
LRWNEKILINNTYFRINKITNFNALEPSVCDVELVKLTRDYQGRRVLYYDLIPCSTGATLHSNSDLMYHLYAYNGNYVKLFDDNLNYLGCFGVSIGDYNDSYTYSHYYLSSGYTTTGVGAYADCNCTGRTELNIIQEEPGIDRAFYFSGTVCNASTNVVFTSTTPSLSASTVYKVYNPLLFNDYCLSGVTGTFAQDTNYEYVQGYDSCDECGCIQCYVYTFTASTSGLLEWRDCDGIVTDTYLNAGETYTIGCPGARLGSVDGVGTLQIGALCFDGCVTPTPTPTVSLTPSITPSNTTTPSPTPSPQCYDCITYDVYAEFDAAFGFFEYYNCQNVLKVQKIFSFSTIQVCAVQGSIQWIDIPLYDTITDLGSCGNTCVPSVTPTSTSTPTVTPTNTLTPSPTASIGSTPAPTTTPTNTPSITSSPTQTGTPDVTPTPTSTPVTCNCYWLFNETGSPLGYSYTQCGGVPLSDTLAGGAQIRICSEDLPVVDPGMTSTPCGITCTQDSDCTGCT